MVITIRRLSRLAAAGAGLGLLVLGVNPVSASNDALFDRQWSLTQANVPAAWPTASGGGIRIGIVDSGVNRNHDDLKDRVVEAATCTDTGGSHAACTTGGNAGNDIVGHGSHVAGIAAGTMGNGVGIAGVAPAAQLVVARVFKPDGSNDPSADLNDVKAGIDWVVAHGAKVVNLSLGAGGGGLLGGLLGGGSNEGSPLGAAVQAAWAAGAIPVLAAGNDNASLFGASGSYGALNAIVVGATIRNGSVASYSNGLTSGTKWGMVAPGGDSNGVDADMILSTFGGDGCATQNNCYGYLSGTSMAAPMVSGAAAVLLSQGLSREQVVQTLLANADKVSCGAGCQGRLNVAKAVAVNAGSNGGGGGGDTTAPTPTTRKRTTTSKPAASAAPTTEVTGAPATSAPESTTTTEGDRREAIVLNTDSAAQDDGVPPAAAVAAVALLAIASFGTVSNVRRSRNATSSA